MRHTNKRLSLYQKTAEIVPRTTFSKNRLFCAGFYLPDVGSRFMSGHSVY